MNKGVKFNVVILIAIILASGLALASFQYKNNNIETSYSAGEKIRGTINMSFTAEPTDSILKSNFNGTIKLIELIKENQLEEGVDYTCTYFGCFDNYKSAGEISSYSLDDDESLLIGFKVTGSDMEISSLKLSVQSNAGISCSRQLIIDVLDKNESFIQSNKNSGNLCGSELTGCFNPGAATTLADVTTDLYCENISLEPAPAYKIGATLKKGSATDITMTLYDLDWQVLGDCILPNQTQTTEQLGCTVNYTITKKGDYFVCISSDSDAGYQIRTEESSPKCGTSTGGEPYNIDFDIFARPFEFGAIGTLNVNESMFYDLNNEQELASYADIYIGEIYQRNCSKGCIIPFKLTGISQDLTFANAEIKYKKGGSPLFTETNLYKLDKDKSKITTPKPINLDLSYAGFSIPIGSKASKFYLYLNNKEILPKPLNISIAPSFSFDIYPKNVLFGVKTNFQATTSSNIISATWNFGDGTTKTSAGKTISHRYTDFEEEGYTLEVELTRTDGVKARNSFDISFGDLRESATNLLAEYTTRMSNLTKQIDAFSPFVASKIKTKLNITKMQNSLNQSKKNFANATSNEDYLAVISEALLINPPTLIFVSEQGNDIPIEFGFEGMDVGYLEQISGTTLSESGKENLKRSISAWIQKNYDGNIDYEIISKRDDNNEKTFILSKFKLDITKKQGADASASESYLIIDYPRESLVFAGNYSEKTVGSGTYIPITGSSTIEFIVYDEVEISSLGMYVSPEISKLGAFEAVEIVTPGGFQWGKFILWTSILLILALAIYIALQEWYKRNYESHLFKNPAELYNIINFIHNSRRNLDDSEISRKLKNAGWTGERITYAFRKLDGKRTGMFEIPIFRFLEKRKIQQEIEKRRVVPQAPEAKPLLK